LKTVTLERPKLIDINNFDIDLMNADSDDADFITLTEHGVKTSF
jgi:hypothetical protein